MTPRQASRTRSLASLAHAYLIHQPDTAYGLAARLRLDDPTKARVALGRMTKEGKLKVIGTVIDPETKRPRYIYEGVNDKLTLTSKVVLTLLTHSSMSAVDIADELNWTPGGVQTTLARLMARPGRRARIARWDRDESLRWIAQYGLGSAPDMPKPAPFTNAENIQRWRERKRIRELPLIMFNTNEKEAA